MDGVFAPPSATKVAKTSSGKKRGGAPVQFSVKAVLLVPLLGLVAALVFWGKKQWLDKRNEAPLIQAGAQTTVSASVLAPVSPQLAEPVSPQPVPPAAPLDENPAVAATPPPSQPKPPGNNAQAELQGMEKTRASFCGTDANNIRDDMEEFFHKNKKYPESFVELRKLNLPDHRDPLRTGCQNIYLLPLTAKKYFTGLSGGEGFLVALRPLPMGGPGWDCVFIATETEWRHSMGCGLNLFTPPDPKRIVKMDAQLITSLKDCNQPGWREGVNCVTGEQF